MKLDKKVSGGEIKFVLARKLGEAQFGQLASDAMVEQLL